MTIEPLGTLARTHTCGALTGTDVGQDVVLLGWVHRVRDLGSLDVLRPPRSPRRHPGGGRATTTAAGGRASGCAPSSSSPSSAASSSRSRRRSTRRSRPARSRSRAREIRLLNDAKTPPFPITDESVISEEMRLKYRYLDLRRPRMQHNMILRHRATMEIRQYFDEQGFLEIETPMLTKSTPEGARDYLVPSRVHPGEFFALPQSPQIFKQILMIAGIDRYFQIVKCFRDEDLRADRQPEFTQVDLEISFATEDLVFSIARAADGAADGAHRPRRAAAVPPHAVRGGDREVRVRQAGPAVRDGDRRRCRPRSPTRRSRSSATRSRRRGGARIRRSPAPRGTRAGSWTSSSTRRSSSAPPGWSGRGATAEGAVQSSALKAAGEEAIRRALELAGAGPAICC